MKALLAAMLMGALAGPCLAANAAPDTGAMTASAGPNANELPGRKAAAVAMLAACHQREEMEAYFDKLAESTAATARVNYSQLSDDQWKQFTQIFRDNLHGYLDKYIALAVSINVTHFSEADMTLMADFCRSPVGQKVSALRAQIERETFDLRYAWLQNAVMAAGADALEKVQASPQEGKGL